MAAEVLGILALVSLVAVFGPADRSAAQHFAERLGDWIGPLSGAIFCFLGGYWAASRAPTRRYSSGLLVGTVAAAIDVGLLVALGTPWRLLFVVSNAGRILFGGLGGACAPKARHPEPATHERAERR